MSQEKKVLLPFYFSPQWIRLLKSCVLCLVSCVLCLVSCSSAFANNLSVSNVSIAARDATADTATIQFDIAWANSWRNQENWDAAWVFFKYTTDGGTTWSHATLKTAGTDPTGFSTGAGTSVTITVPTDKVGAFIYRSAIGNGSLSTTAIKFVWDYGTDGVADAASVTVKVFGIEMVYIPTGSFYLGDGNGSTEAAYAFHVTDNTSFQVTTSNTANVTVDTNANDDIDTSAISIDGDGGITGNASYPTGYTAFYLMKYEVSEGQWVDFFNSLTSAQKATRDITSNVNGGKNSDSTVNRNTVAWTSGDATTTRSNRACGFLSWMDLAAFLDWAALRPLTEIEFEKASRGPSSSVVGEYAWGTVNATAAATISSTEDGTETITTSAANIAFSNTTFTGGDAGLGPLRGGIFATASTETRAEGGSGYYGHKDLSGNLWERCVTIGNSSGRSFTGSHGDGVLTSVTSYEGNATNLDWPGLNGTSSSRGITGAAGSSMRGGAYSTTTSCKLSDRTYGGYTEVLRAPNYGGRGARSADA